jgi:hypothetical protein
MSSVSRATSGSPIAEVLASIAVTSFIGRRRFGGKRISVGFKGIAASAVAPVAAGSSKRSALCVSYCRQLLYVETFSLKALVKA